MSNLKSRYQFRDAASALLPLKACSNTLFSTAKMPAFQIHIADENDDENESLSILSPRRSMAY